MSGSRLNPAERHLAEQHLGDRLAALVDGELGHDTRERVLAHLATCPKCKAEADAQRQLKTYFASTAPPGPSESFLARLQGLPEGGGDDRGDPDSFGGAPTDTVFTAEGEGAFGLRPGGLAYASDGHGVLRGGASGRGFRIHDVGRSREDRSSGSRGRRFAFAAAGAVSLAALALGGVSGGPAPADAGAESRGSRATPMRTQGAQTAASTDSSRRRTGGSQSRGVLASPLASTGVGAPGVPGFNPLPGDRAPQLRGPVASPVLTGEPALFPLIPPATGSPQYPAQPGSGRALGGGQAAGPSAPPALPTMASGEPTPGFGISLTTRR